MVITKKVELPPNPFHVPRNELLHKEVRDYKRSISLVPFNIPELLNIFKEKDIILIGAPGTGKSSLLRLLVWDVLLEINRNFEKKFEFIKNYLCSSEKEKIIPFFAFYINLNEDIRKDFAGSNLSQQDYERLFLNYLSLFIISRFIRNLKQYFIEINKSSEIKRDINWTSENIPKFLSKSKNIGSLLEIILNEINVIQDFLSSYDEIEEKKKRIRFDDSLFFSQVIGDIFNSLEINIDRVILIIDDLSLIPDNLIKSVLKILGNRFENVEIKLSTRHKKLIRDKILELDRRDLIRLDLDFYLINLKKNFYYKMAKEIVRNRLIQKNFVINNIDEAFPGISEIDEAYLYDKFIQIVRNDRFFLKVKNTIINIFNDKKQQNLIDNYIVEDEEKYKSQLIDEIKKKDLNGNLKGKYIKKLLSTPDLYNKLIEIENPLTRKITEILVAREYNGKIINVPIDELIIKINEKVIEIEKNSNITTIALHLLARDAKREKIFAGFNQIVNISSYVIKQLLEILEKIFDNYIISQTKLNKSIYENISIPYYIQNEAIHIYAKKFVEEKLRRGSHFGPILYKFLITLKRFFERQFSIKASYRDGHTGFSFSSLNDYISLRSLEIFNEALANSYFQSKDISKGYTAEYEKISHYTLYLNRLICVYFSMPIEYGGYRSTTYNDIKKFLLKGELPKDPIKKKKLGTLDKFIKM